MLNQQSPLHRCCRSPASMRWPPHTLKKRTLFSLNVLQSICISISLIMYKLAFVVKVNTKHGTKMVLSVSKTFLKLKDLILEKNTLQEQVIHLMMVFSEIKRRMPYCSWSRWKQSTSTFALKSIFTRKSSAASQMNSTTHGKDLGLKSRMCKGNFFQEGGVWKAFSHLPYIPDFVLTATREIKFPIIQVLCVKDQRAAQKASQCRTDFACGTRWEAASVERPSEGAAVFYIHRSFFYIQWSFNSPSVWRDMNLWGTYEKEAYLITHY